LAIDTAAIVAGFVIVKRPKSLRKIESYDPGMGKFALSACRAFRYIVRNWVPFFEQRSVL
jgi:hypothetical protein